MVIKTWAAMAEASKVVLGGFEIGADVKIVKHPGRYADSAGVAFWHTVMRLAGPAPEFAKADDVVRHNSRTGLVL